MFFGWVLCGHSGCALHTHKHFPPSFALRAPHWTGNSFLFSIWLRQSGLRPQILCCSSGLRPQRTFSAAALSVFRRTTERILFYAASRYRFVLLKSCDFLASQGPAGPRGKKERATPAHTPPAMSHVAPLSKSLAIEIKVGLEGPS